MICLRFFLLIFLSSLFSLRLSGQGQVLTGEIDADKEVGVALNYLHANQVDKAIVVCREMLQLFPDYGDFKYILGIAYIKMGRTDWAKSYLEGLLETHVHYKDAYPLLSKVYVRDNNYEEAWRLWQKAKVLFPLDTTMLNGYKMFMDEYEENLKRNRYDSIYVELKTAWKEKRWAVASNKIYDMEQLSPGDRQVQYWKANTLWQAGEEERALTIYEDLKNTGDTSIYVIRQMTLLEAELKNFKKAIAYNDILLNHDPVNATYRDQAVIYQELESYTNYVLLSHIQTFYGSNGVHYSISGVEYGRRWGAATVVGLVNYSQRSSLEGFQLGAEAWTPYTTGYYAYNHLSWSNSLLFPQWKIVYTLYHERSNWLLDVGGRYLRSGDSLNIYSVVGSVGCYFASNLLYLRAFLVNDSFRWNQVYSLSFKHYYKTESRESFVSVSGSTGTSPDDPSRYRYLGIKADFSTKALGVSWQHRLRKWVWILSGSWNHYKVGENVGLHQYDVGLSLKRYF